MQACTKTWTNIGVRPYTANTQTCEKRHRNSTCRNSTTLLSNRLIQAVLLLFVAAHFVSLVATLPLQDTRDHAIQRGEEGASQQDGVQLNQSPIVVPTTNVLPPFISTPPERLESHRRVIKRNTTSTARSGSRRKPFRKMRRFCEKPFRHSRQRPGEGATEYTLRVKNTYCKICQFFLRYKCH